MKWDKSIERQEIQLNYYNTRMIYFQNQEIIKDLKRIKYNNIFLSLNVDEIEESLELISEKIQILTNNMNLYHLNFLYFNLSFYLSLLQEKITVNLAKNKNYTLYNEIQFY